MKNIITIILSINLFVLSSTILRAQDWHFSQFDNAPLLVNPAAAGSYQGDYRANINYKNQWSSVATPYRTMAASADMPLLRNFNGYKMTGVGISFLADKAGKSGYGFTQINLNVSQAVSTGKFQEISLGLSFGYGQISANLSDLRWDNQYNGVEHDPSLSTGEGLYFPTSNYFDISAGIMARFFSRDLNETQIGLSASHLTRPWQATLSDVNDDVLRMKIILHGKTEVPFTQISGRYLIPSIYLAQQGASTEIMAGVQMKTILGVQSRVTGYNNQNFLYIGGHYRYRDALIASVGYEWKSMLKATLSYDLNFSTLLPASSSRGGIELSLVWLGNFGFSSGGRSNSIRRNTF